MSLISPHLAKILVCPVDQGELEQDVEKSVLKCVQCGRTFPVKDGIPVMIVKDSERASDE